MDEARTIPFDVKLEMPSAVELGILPKEHRAIVREAVRIINSKGMEEICNAHLEEKYVCSKLWGHTFTYEPTVPCEVDISAMTFFDANSAFHFACHSFISKAEIVQTVLTELYRFKYSKLKGRTGRYGEVGIETHAAYNFSSYIYEEIFE